MWLQILALDKQVAICSVKLRLIFNEHHEGISAIGYDNPVLIGVGNVFDLHNSLVSEQVDAATPKELIYAR